MHLMTVTVIPKALGKYTEAQAMWPLTFMLERDVPFGHLFLLVNVPWITASVNQVAEERNPGRYSSFPRSIFAKPRGAGDEIAGSKIGSFWT